MTERLHFHFSLHALEKEMATHPSVLAWYLTTKSGAESACVYVTGVPITWLTYGRASETPSYLLSEPRLPCQPWARPGAHSDWIK